jgi:hypothetical protein
MLGVYRRVVCTFPEPAVLAVYYLEKEGPAGLTKMTAGRGIRGGQERFIAKVFEDLREKRGQDESKLRDIKARRLNELCGVINCV